MVYLRNTNGSLSPVWSILPTQWVYGQTVSPWHYDTGGFPLVNDGDWHSYEIHLKTDTGSSNGIYRFWLDGVLQAEHLDVDLGQATFTWFGWPSNQTLVTGDCWYSWQDDIAVYTVTPTNTDADGNAMIGPLDWATTPTSMSGVTVRGGSVQ